MSSKRESKVANLTQQLEKQHRPAPPRRRHEEEERSNRSFSHDRFLQPPSNPEANATVILPPAALASHHHNHHYHNHHNHNHSEQLQQEQRTTKQSFNGRELVPLSFGKQSPSRDELQQHTCTLPQSTVHIQQQELQPQQQLQPSSSLQPSEPQPSLQLPLSPQPQPSLQQLPPPPPLRANSVAILQQVHLQSETSLPSRPKKVPPVPPRSPKPNTIGSVTTASAPLKLHASLTNPKQQSSLSKLQSTRTRLQNCKISNSHSSYELIPTRNSSASLWNVLNDEQKHSFKKLWLKVDQELQWYLKNRRDFSTFMNKAISLRKRLLVESVVLLLFEITAEHPSAVLFKHILINAMIKNSQIEEHKKCTQMKRQLDMEESFQSENILDGEKVEEVKEDCNLPQEVPNDMSDFSFDEKILQHFLLIPRTEDSIPKKFNNGKLGQTLRRAYDIVVKSNEFIG